MALTILEKINIAKLSQAYAVVDIYRSGLYGGGVDLTLPRKIYCLRKNVEFLYDQLIAPLVTPTLGADVITTTRIDLNWNEVPNATAFVLQRATNSNFTTGLTTIYSGSLFVFSDTGLSFNTTYYYRIKATATGFTDSGYGVATAATGGGIFDSSFDISFY